MGKKRFLLIKPPFFLFISPMELVHHGLGFFRKEGPPTIGPAQWAWPDLIVVWEGELSFTSGAETFRLEVGDALLIPPGNPFQGMPVTQEAAIWVFHFRDYEPMDAGSPFAVATTPHRFPRVCRDRGSRGLLGEFTARWRRSPAPQQERALRLLGELILLRVEEGLPREPARFQAAVEAALGERPAGRVAAMARHVGASPSAFRQAFHKHYGVSPRQYLQSACMGEARRLLQETDQPIKEISQQLGYRDVVAFHRAFVKETGLTPGACRRQRGKVI